MISLATEIWKTWECFLPFQWPAFGTMWLLAIALFLGIKVALILRGPDLSLTQQLGFLACWPGMDLRPFLRRTDATYPTLREGLPPVTCLALGLGIFHLATLQPHPLAGGALGMVSLILCAHFGLFHILALALRGFGIAVTPIMGNPLLVTSLAQFWGGTWNRAFTDAVHPLLVRPLAKRFGIQTGLILAFFASGIAHELVISVPAQGGYGGPLLYFMIQGLGLILERRVRGTRWQVTHGIPGRLYTAITVITPIPILFHPPFLERVIHPFVHFLANLLVLP